MRKCIIGLGLTLILVLSSGCTIVDALLSNVNGYDLTGCSNGWSVCWELYWDNVDRLPSGPGEP